VQVPDLQSTR